MQGISVPPTANILRTRFTSYTPSVPFRPSARIYIYILLLAIELYILSCFLALLIVDGRSEHPLGAYAAGLVLYSLHVLISMCHVFAPLLVTHGLLPPLDDLC